MNRCRRFPRPLHHRFTFAGDLALVRTITGPSNLVVQAHAGEERAGDQGFLHFLAVARRVCLFRQCVDRGPGCQHGALACRSRQLGEGRRRAGGRRAGVLPPTHSPDAAPSVETPAPSCQPAGPAIRAKGPSMRAPPGLRRPSLHRQPSLHHDKHQRLCLLRSVHDGLGGASHRGEGASCAGLGAGRREPGCQGRHRGFALFLLHACVHSRRHAHTHTQALAHVRENKSKTRQST